MRMRTLATTAAAIGALAALPQIVSAQEISGRGFLFGAPAGSLTLRMGYAGASAGSDVFAFVTDELTLRRGDFASFGFGADASFAIRSRLDITFSGDFNGMEKKSEFREWQDNSGNPIEQTTSFRRQTYSAGLKYYVLPYGRSLGRLAWVPARYAPWIAAAAGRTAYTFKQSGDFIDFAANNKVFTDTFDSSRWTTTFNLSGGLDWNIDHRWALTTQAKYMFGKAELGVDYSGFDQIDLSGLGVSAGLTIRF